MIRALKNLIRLAVVSAAGDDSKNVPEQQYTYHGKIGNAIPIYPYGYHAIADQESYALVLVVNGNSEERVSLPTSMLKRPIGKPGEVIIYHPNTGTSIKLNNNGDVEITSVGQVNVDSIAGVVVNAPTVEITAPAIDMIGNVSITGNLEVTGNEIVDGNSTVVGNTILAAGVTSNGVNISATHVHNVPFATGPGLTAGAQ